MAPITTLKKAVKKNKAIGSSVGTPVITPVITIDGPAASGKSSVSRGLAKKLGWVWVSTGTFYRGLAWAAGFSGLSLEDESALVELAKSGRWEVRLAEERTLFFFDGKDQTDEIFKESVGTMASRVSSFPLVRLALLSAQRECLNSVPSAVGLIAEGRDCGSVVFPQAHLKIFLTARAESRAQRRALEEGRSVEAMISEQQARDHQDAHRKVAPMRAPEGSHTIDTSGLSLAEVISRIEAIAAQEKLVSLDVSPL